MIISQVTLEYTIRRVITVVSNEPLTDAELQARAMESDLTIPGDPTDDLFGLRALLRAAACSVVEINRASDTFTVEDGRAIVKRLSEKKCFAPDERLEIYPRWLTAYVINALVGFGLLRQEPGSLNNYQHASYYRVGDPQ